MRIFNRERCDDSGDGRSKAKRVCNMASGSYGVGLNDLEIGIEIRIDGSVEHSCIWGEMTISYTFG